MTASAYVPGQILTADALNTSFDEKTDNADAAITGGSIDGIDHITVVGVTDAVSPTSGAVIVTGGVGIGMALNVAAGFTAGGPSRFLSSVSSTTPQTGAIVVAGGVGIGQNLNVNGAGVFKVGVSTTLLESTDPTNATSPQTGAAKVAGGVGIAKDLWVGGQINVLGTFTAQGGTALQGNVSVGSLTLTAGGFVQYPDGTKQTTKPMADAPSDAKKYGRLNAAWTVLTDIAEAPSDGKKYGRRNAAWIELLDTPDAPNDTFSYGRRNAAWSKVTEEAVSDGFVYARRNAAWVKSVPEAPSDGQQYSRRNGNWQVLSASGMWRGDTPPADTDRYPQWYNTTTSTLYVWYDDGDSAQWVICVPVPATDESGSFTIDWGHIGGTLSNQLDLKAALDAKLGEAPNDGKQYARQSLGWAEVTGGSGGGGIPEAPTDGKLYGRQSSAWAEVPSGGGGGLWTYTDVGGSTSATLKSSGSGSATVAIDGKTAPRLDFKLNGVSKYGISYAGTYLQISTGGGVDFRLDDFGVAYMFCTQFNVYGKNALGTQLYIDTSSTGGMPQFGMNSNGAGGNYCGVITGSKTASPRWDVILGDGSNETGSNAGNNFAIRRYTDAGALAVNNGYAMTINRANANVVFYGPMGIDGTGQATSPGMYFNKPNDSVETAVSFRSAGKSQWYWAHTAVSKDLALARCDANGAYLATHLVFNWTTGDTTISANFSVGGNAYKPGGGSWSDSSDERIKENIQDYASGLEAVLALRPVTYHFRAETGRDTSIQYTGLIAQEAETAMPELVKTAAGKCGEIELEDMRTLDSSAIIYALVNSVKELNARLAAVEVK